MNGAVSSNGSNTCIGDVFRDLTTKWLFGFFMVVDKDSVFRIEARAC